jgi:sepiapterin reductase
MANSIDLNGKLAYLLITGASKGIGAEIAKLTSQKLRAGSTIVLIARSLDGLESTKAEIMKANNELKVFVKSVNLNKPSAEDLKLLICETYDTAIGYDLAMIVHNVGSIGDVSKSACDIDDYAELESYFSTNVFAPMILNNIVLKLVPQNTKKFIVNITSKAAIVAFKSFAFYCPGKAARESFFKVLAEERGDLLILNYAPGPVETQMTVDAQQKAGHAETSNMFKQLRETGTMLTTEQTTKRFLEIIAKGNFKSGDHVDYFDEI